ncbi:uncharacterized protein LOC128309209 [Anopheles moucheti]|uniref:uncharacterized protein LOC128309209 n=1 Tax=Anopheles moucheti TaxID=186751 RepID=UPI0022F132E3|nr:uncharacterized protein LOC128309209 [Anopheles moucheti]
MSSPEETQIIEEQRRLSQNGVLNAGFIHLPPTDAPSTLQQTLQLLQQQLAQQQQLLSQLVQQHQQQSQPPNPDQQLVPKPSYPELILDALAGNISEFRYDPEAGLTFESWYARYIDLFQEDASRLDDAAKVRLLGRKLGTAEHARFSNFILPRVLRDFSFSEMVEKLTVLFGKMESVLSKRFKCFNISKTCTEDLLAFTCRVNKACVEAEFSSMTEDDFKCLILVCGLKDESVRDIRMKLLAAIEDKKYAPLEQLAAECQRLVRVKADSAMIATDTSERVHAMHARSSRQWHRNNNGNERHTKSAPRRTAEICSWEEKFSTVFSGTSLCTKVQIHLQLRQESRPVFRPKRPVAYAIEDAVNNELDRLEKLGIITPCDYSDWAAPVVVVRKANGKIRLCGDYSTGLNAALHPHEYPLPLPQDIFSKLDRCVTFTQIDLSDAFLQVEIEEKSRPPLTINTHRGLYYYNRLPPGIKVAPGSFQQIMDKMLAGVNGVSAYMDDVIVGGKTQEEHDAALKETLQRIKDYGFTIRKEKCSFNKPEIRYLGHIIDSRVHS